MLCNTTPREARKLREKSSASTLRSKLQRFVRSYQGSGDAVAAALAASRAGSGRSDALRVRELESEKERDTQRIRELELQNRALQKRFKNALIPEKGFLKIRCCHCGKVGTIRSTPDECERKRNSL